MDIKAERERERMCFSQTQITKHSHRQKYSYCIRVYEQHQFPLTILNEKSVFDSLLIQMLHVKESFEHFQTSVTQGKQLK